MSRDNPNRLWLFFSNIFGFLTSLVTIGLTIYAYWKEKWVFSDVAVLVLALSIVALTIFIVRLLNNNHKLYTDYCDAPHKIKGLEEQIRCEQIAQKKIVQTFHNFSHHYRKIVVYLHDDLINNGNRNFEKRKGMFHGFLTVMISNIKEVFDILTGGDCAVCIKLLDVDNEVGTLMRDAISARERSDAARHLKKYHYLKNTAFDEILDKFNPRNYYYCNNLQKLGLSYKNGNESWKEHYNACLVAPIRFVLSSDENGFEDARVIGFICVDNFKGGFDGNIARDTLASYVDLCFDIFKVYSELDDIASNSG